MRRNAHSTFWKICSGLVIVSMVVLSPLSAKLDQMNIALAAGDAVDPITASPDPAPPGAIPVYDVVQHTIAKLKSNIAYQLKFAAYLGLLNAATYFAQTVAYDTAEWAANGFKGKAPGIFTDPFGTYTQNLFLDSLGEFMGTFSENFTNGVFGFDLCRPPNFPDLALQFALGLPGLSLNAIQRPHPKCSWTDITHNWQTSVQSLNNAESIKNIQANFSTGGNDVSFGVGVHLGFLDYSAEKTSAGLRERMEGNGFKSVSNFLTGNIETPAQTVQRNIENSIIENPAATLQTTQGAAFTNAFNMGWIQLGVVTLSTFTNVLLSRLLGKIAKGLFKTSGGGLHALPNLGNPNASPLSSTKPDEIFASQFSDILTPKITRPDALDLLTELSGCPSEGRTKWNCTLDEGLATALRQGGGMTVRQAIDQTFLDPSWQLIPSTRLKDNEDATCRSRAFCVSNLRKLRLARIIPVGWELAADAQSNQVSCAQSKGCVTLGEVMQNYDKCNDQGQLDKDHPWCHLIDPNWVLTVFPAQCLTQGFGNTLLTGTSERLQECQDTATCLQRDANGACTGGYGFCMAEQTFWQFDALTCKEQFASCRTYTPRGPNAKDIGYLRSTIDYGSCNESNVGCMWYATKRDPLAKDENSGWNNGFTSTADRVYFDKNILPCDASNDGCTSLRRVVAGESALNLVENGSFESVTGTPAVPRAWLFVNSPNASFVSPQVSAGTAAVDGQAAYYASPNALRTNDMFGVVQPLREYTLSFFARRFIDAPAGSYVTLAMAKADGGLLSHPANEATYYRSVGCSATAPASSGNIKDQAVITIPSTLGDEWQRFSCTFVTPPDVGDAVVIIKGGTSDSASPLVDAVQLEETERATDFVDGLSGALATVTMKVPPDELACAGEASDNPLCARFARVCRQNEAGCAGYRPKGDVSGPEVPAVVNPRDFCPAECVGYAEFRKQASTFDLARDPDPRLDDPEDDTVATFIPSTGLVCAAQDVGCEVFTNLDADTAGGEAQSGFNYLRSCEKPGSDSQTYYTWEGSDTSGYQLKTWSLKRDPSQPVPQGPKIIVKADADGFLKDPNSCNANAYLQATDPDCRQFYDPLGNVFYRFETQTVLSSEDCRQYRKDNSDVADCSKTGGSFNSASAQCVYQADSKKSRTCDVAFAGCRGYVGTQGKAQTQVFNEDFGSVDFKATTSSTPGASLSQSDESILVGDKSLRVEVPANATDGVSFGPITQMAQGGLYELSFWAKTLDPTRPAVSVTQTGDTTPIGTVSLETDWRAYRVGPFTATSTGAAVRYLTLSGLKGLTFFDKVRVEQVTDITYVIKDSWNTPAVCDQTPEGIPQPQAMLGCRTYVDRDAKEVNVSQFSHLCRETAIGCTAYVNTRNSVSPYAESWSHDAAPESQLDTPARPAKEITVRGGDRYDYYIEDKTKFCKPENASCRAFGKPNFSQDRHSLDAQKPFDTVYLRDDVTKYDEGLCSEPELFCEAFTSVAGTDYFRAPSDHACEYRTAAVVQQGSVPGMNTSGVTYDGWFRVGTDIPCYPDLLKNGSAFGIRFTGDPGYNAWAYATTSYRGWTGTCPQEQSECTELRDVTDKSDTSHPLGRPYFVIKDGRLDTTSCNGQVDPSRGCVLFRDMTDTRLTYSTKATSEDYKARAYQPVNPLDCNLQPNHPACAQKYCTGMKANDPNNALQVSVAQAAEGRQVCSTDADCSVKCPLPASGSFLLSAACTTGRCAVPQNDSNIVINVKPDRACSQWLSCSTGETVYDPQQGEYRSICTELKLCNRAGAPEGAGVPFCANYVDRNYPGLNTALTQYRVLDAKTYSSRQTGFGSVDFSGMSIPDQYQVLDAKLVPIGAMLTLDPRVKSQFKKDYRLAVRLPSGLAAFSTPANPTNAEQQKSLAASPSLKPFSCVVAQTGAFGLLTDKNGVMDADHDGALDVGEDVYCWVSMDQGQPPSLGAEGAPITADNLNALSLATRFADDPQPALDQTLNHSFPNSQCKAAPEADAPFGNEFVVEWDDTVTPPRAKRTADGYGQSNLCEFGENCACVYKRVKYGAAASTSKFYEPLSTSVTNAICVGGPRDGLPCIVDVGIKGSQPSGKVQPIKADGTADGEPIDIGEATKGEKAPGTISSANRCGEGGVCTVLSSAQLVRGVTGQCLQYDLSRVVAGDQTRNECLVWNPNPVLAGPGDQYHWVPTAGFQPPQSSGRYYCTAPFRQPQTFQFQPEVKITVLGVEKILSQGLGFSKNKKGTYAGSISANYYSDDFASDKSCLDIPNPFGDDCDGNHSGASLDGHDAEGTDMGLWCEQADDDQEPTSDFGLVRLITTGSGVNRSYTEYAYLFNQTQIGEAISKSKDPEIVRDNTLEDTISNFQFRTDTGKLGCEYSEDFVPGIGSLDYDDEDSWRGPDGTWQAGFKAEMTKNGGKLDRRNAQIVTEDGTPTGIPVKVNCASKQNESSDGTCFLKAWTLDYRAEGQEKFQAFGPDVGRSSMDALSSNPVYGKCNADHSWFSIRAVFEDTNTNENEMDASDVNPERLQGPFQAVGFWVTACSPYSGPRYIYTYVSMSTADVCRELAETISKDSHDSTAFTDRNSSRSGFAMPRNGYTWGTTNIPFGASLATGDAGIEPLYMSGVKQGASNPLHPPTFTFPGQTYFRPEAYPTSNWGLLSNVFARIYRIYGYSSRGVTAGDWACTAPHSPNFGQWCPNLDDATASERAKQSASWCGIEAKCVGGGLSSSDIFAQKACNSFSGVNRGLDCSADSDICHKAPMQLSDEGILAPAYGTCVVKNDTTVQWVQNKANKHWRCSGSTDEGTCPSECRPEIGCGRATAVNAGAFRCGPGTVREPGKVLETADGVKTFASFCTKPSDKSPECPLWVAPGAEACEASATAGVPGHCAEHPWAECNADKDCSFTARNFWPSGLTNSFFSWSERGQFVASPTLGNHMKGFARAEPNAAGMFRYGGWPGSTYQADKPGLAALCASNDTSQEPCLLRSAFPPDALYKGESPFFATPIAPALNGPGADPLAFTWRGIAGDPQADNTPKPWNDIELLKLYPGFAPFIFKNDSYGCSPNWAGDAVPTGATTPCRNSASQYAGDALKWVDQGASAPFGHFEWNTGSQDVTKKVCRIQSGITKQNLVDQCNNSTTESQCNSFGNCTWADGVVSVPIDQTTERGKMVAHYGACEPVALMFRDGVKTGGTLGTCRGGARSGSICQSDKECRPTGMKEPDFQKVQKDAEEWCNPVTTGKDAGFGVTSKTLLNPGNEACWEDLGTATTAPNAPAKESDPALDNNICTHPPGYWPRPNFCIDPNDEYCGLFGYDLSPAASLDASVNNSAPLPTDVSAGLYKATTLNKSGTNVGAANNYSYVVEYLPEPPRVAAPDIRTCSGGQCRVSGLNTIGLDGVNEGVVNGGAGGHVATMRFYAWAAHDQMPLRRMVIDWGDGVQTELPDTFLKNHKPYCQTPKECSLTPGLTCQSDQDCPPGGGTCENFGTCNDNPSIRCSKDAQCDAGGKPGVCNPRVFFGNDGDACEQQYFEFRHAYSCLQATKPPATCVNQGACSSDPDRSCSVASDCSAGDRCIQNTATTKGCFDQGSNTCRFTPRVMVVDNWGWCTGECRATLNQSGLPVDNFSEADVRHPNGGCYDGSLLKRNTDAKRSTGAFNECDVSFPKKLGAYQPPFRPWIVFPGSIQLLSGDVK